MVQTATVIRTVPTTDWPNGPLPTQPVRAVPANFDGVNVALNCTTGNLATPFTGFAHPFNSVAQSITFGIQWSWDGGVTFPESTEQTEVGNPTGNWGNNRQGVPQMTPTVSLGIPAHGSGPDGSIPVFPDHYRPYAVVAGGPISTGVTVTEFTG